MIAALPIVPVLAAIAAPTEVAIALWTWVDVSAVSLPPPVSPEAAWEAAGTGGTLLPRVNGQSSGK